MKKPIILTTRSEIEANGVHRYLVNVPYAKAIEKAGATLLVLAAMPDDAAVEEILDRVDGILFPGGDDVDPKLYGEERKEYSEIPDTIRDAMEYKVLKAALARKMPILAICRGHQLINVYNGGSLYQDIAKEMPNSINHDGHGKPRNTITHQVAVKEGTLLHSILKTTDIGVNSLHHQGIKQIGKDLIATATAPDGLIEGIEIPGYPFFVGVQWHPEELAADPVWQNLFNAFVAKCSE